MEIHQKQNGLRQKHGKRPFCRKNINSPSRNGKGNLASQSVLDARNAAPARSFRHSLRYGLAHARIKRRRQNVILIQFVLADQPRNGIGCRALHLIVDVACPHIKRAAEDAGERKHVVHLVRKIAPAGGNHARAACLCFLRENFRRGVRHRQTGPHPSPWFLPFPL